MSPAAAALCSAEAVPAPDTGSVRGDLLVIVRAVIAYVMTPAGRTAVQAAALPSVDSYAEARPVFWAARLYALRTVVERDIARGDLRPDTDGRLLLETIVEPVHGRLLLTGEPVDDALAERLVDLVLDGAARAEP